MTVCWFTNCFGCYNEVGQRMAFVDNCKQM